MLSVDDLRAKVRVVEDFPKPGISFKDITPLLQDGEAWRAAIGQFAALCRVTRPELIVAPEARGFMIAAPLAYELGVGWAPVRKKGKLPAATLRGEYQLEYGADVLEIHQDAVKPGQRVLVVDDVLATGGTISTTIDLVKELGGVVAGVGFLLELTYLPGREKLSEYQVVSLIRY